MAEQGDSMPAQSAAPSLWAGPLFRGRGENDCPMAADRFGRFSGFGVHGFAQKEKAIHVGLMRKL